MMRKLNKKALVTALMVALILTTTVGGTLAYLIDKTDPVENTFKPASADITVDEPEWDDGDTVKKNVTIKNDNEGIKVYVRAKIVVTWQDSTGNVYPKLPVAGEDYDITTGDGKGWTLVDGYYYYNDILNPGANTAELIETCSPVADKQPEGYTLHVEVLAQAVQADGMTGVDSAQDAFAKLQ